MEGNEVVAFFEASNHWILCSLPISCTIYPGIFQAQKLEKIGYSLGFKNISQGLSVKLYCTTDAVSSTTVSDGQYITRDSISISAGCSVDHELQHANDVGWTAVPTKHKCIEGRT